MAGEQVVVEPRVLLEEAYVQAALSLPPNTQINLEIDNDVAAVRVIPNLVAEILHNLVTNGIQAMPKGGTITLKARNAGHLVALEVVDTGVGIPLQNQTKIFGLFYSTKHSSGFGLWNARRYALKCGGDLRVESQVGQGTTFKLLLPRINGEVGGTI
jgi:signal transduction histidine kinase